jgi:hypothetical protein
MRGGGRVRLLWLEVLDEVETGITGVTGTEAGVPGVTGVTGEEGTGGGGRVGIGYRLRLEVRGKAGSNCAEGYPPVLEESEERAEVVPVGVGEGGRWIEAHMDSGL